MALKEGTKRKAGVLALILSLWITAIAVVSVSMVWFAVATFGELPENQGSFYSKAAGQAAFVLLLLVLPAYFMAKIYINNPIRLWNKPNVSVGWLPVLLTLVTTFCVAVVAQGFLTLPETLPLPESIQSFAQILQEATVAEQENFIKTDTVLGFLVSLGIMAFLAAFSEELLFRGTLQSLYLKAGIPPLFAISIAAFLFALIHLQIYYLPVLFAVGFWLGLVYHWSEHIAYPMIAHFFNNALIVVLSLFAAKGFIPEELVMSTEPAPPALLYTCTVLLPLLLFFTYRTFKKDSLAAV